MINIYSRHIDAKKFANIIQQANLESNQISIGKFILYGQKGVDSSIQYNKKDLDMLDNKHEYTFPVSDGELEISLQLYQNVSNHYRLFCFSKCNDQQGMLFSLNLTTEKQTDGSIFLTQKIKFSDRIPGNKEFAKKFRRMKQKVLVEMLRNLDFEVTNNNDLILGIFDAKKIKLLDTTKDQFIHDFIMISIIKGHFMGNKGYKLKVMPPFEPSYDFDEPDVEESKLSDKIKNQRHNRNIPLGLRFKVLERDGGKCKLCGRSPEDGIKLHVDHIKPYSLGGITVMSNLQSLCSECNIGKSNKSTTKF